MNGQEISLNESSDMVRGSNEYEENVLTAQASEIIVNLYGPKVIFLVSNASENPRIPYR